MSGNMRDMVREKKRSKEGTVSVSGRMDTNDHAQLTGLLKHFGLTKTEFARKALYMGLDELRAVFNEENENAENAETGGDGETESDDDEE